MHKFQKIITLIVQKLLKQYERFTLSNSEGFTVVEIMVVISIFGILAGITLFSFASFSNNISLQNVAQDVAIRIVEAQRSATSGYVSTFDSTINADYQPSYGVYFQDLSAGLDVFTLFIDRAESSFHNAKYDVSQTCPSTTGECRSITTFQNGYGIKRICANLGTVCSITKAYVRFERPYLDAKIYQELSGGILSPNYSDLEIELYSPKGNATTIIVHSVGQVEVLQGTIFQIYPPGGAGS